MIVWLAAIVQEYGEHGHYTQFYIGRENKRRKASGSTLSNSSRTTRSQVQPPPGPEKAFGAALRHLRRRQGFSQEKLALDAGFDRTYISLVERGLRSPTVRAVVKLAEVLEVPPSEIIKRMEAHLSGESTPPEVASAGRRKRN